MNTYNVPSSVFCALQHALVSFSWKWCEVDIIMIYMYVMVNAMVSSLVQRCSAALEWNLNWAQV